MPPPYLSVAVPLFNEEGNLPLFLEQLTRACERRTADFEIILCDDGSSDRTAELALDWRQNDPRVKLLRLSRNFGHHAAAQAGMDHARGEWLLCIDGDLQDPPDLLDALFAKADEGFEVIHAKKRSRQESGLRGLGMRLFHSMIGHTSSDMPLEANLGYFALIRRCAYQRLREMPERRKFLAGMRQWIGFRQAVVEFDRPQRHAGTSRQSLRRLIVLALDAFFAYSSRPILAIWMLGIVGIVLSLFSIGYAVVAKIQGTALQGWSSTITAIVFIGSVQLVSVSILGEYIWRIYVEVQRRPYYLLREKHGLDSETGTPNEADARENAVR